MDESRLAKEITNPLDQPIKRMAVILIIALFYVGVPLAILFDFIGFEYKFVALTVGAIVVLVILRLIGFSFEDMGITIKNSKSSILHILPLTILLAISGIIIYLSGYSRITPNESWLFFIFYIFISSPAQEFLYRGALHCTFESLKMGFGIRLMLSSLLYSFVHIIYHDWLTLVLTFAIGLIWYFCYNKTRNLTGVSISHAVLGLVTILAGIIN